MKQATGYEGRKKS